MKNLKALLTTVIVVAIVFVAYKVIPLYMANYQFQEGIQEISRTAAYGSVANDDQIRHQIAEKITATEIPLKPEDVIIQRGSQDCLIWAAYTVHVDFPIHPVDLHFTNGARNGDKMENPPQ